MPMGLGNLHKGTARNEPTYLTACSFFSNGFDCEGHGRCSKVLLALATETIPKMRIRMRAERVRAAKIKFLLADMSLRISSSVRCMSSSSFSFIGYVLLVSFEIGGVR